MERLLETMRPCKLCDRLIDFRVKGHPQLAVDVIIQLVKRDPKQRVIGHDADTGREQCGSRLEAGKALALQAQGLIDGRRYCWCWIPHKFTCPGLSKENGDGE